MTCRPGSAGMLVTAAVVLVAMMAPALAWACARGQRGAAANAQASSHSGFQLVDLTRHLVLTSG
jgi:hypothetical protein